ncbi:type VII secretion protein EccE [Actinoplanes utahensis]|uniref:type VII secretion protein EccE n=1 Tax=Actinoplanes utahensis TaxID=1869 RepID=UPI00126A6A3C|nr:type VII secretion protein EccE [Actinoplanes utahensis]
MSTEVAVPMADSLIRPRRAGRLLGIRAEQIVATQVAAVLVLAGLALGGIALIPAVAGAVALLTLTWLRLRGRWAFQWLGVLARFSGRRRAASIDDPAALLTYAAPRVRATTLDLPGGPAVALADDAGLTVLVELGDPADESSTIPSFAALLQATGRDHTPGGDQPRFRTQLVLSAVSAPSSQAGASRAQGSYRTLVEGNSLGHLRAVLALRVFRTGGWSEEELRRSLAGMTRRLTRRLGAAQVRPLGEVAALRAIADLANSDESGTAAACRESWSGVRLGGLVQATFRCQPAAGAELPAHLVTRILHLPTAATTLSMSSTALFIRLAAEEATELESAARALRGLLSAERIRVRRWDGAHLPGLAATLPLGGAGEDGGAEFSVPALPISPSGLMIGRNQSGGAVLLRLFRPEPTRALLVGGLQGAQMVAFRSMAVGARVQVRTTRPQAWEPFVRGAAVPGESITVLPPGRPFDAPAGSVRHPILTILDTGTTPAGPEDRETGWRTTLVVRDDFGPADVPHATEADVVVLQRLRPEEATLLGNTLSLGETATYFPRMRTDMVAVINRRAVRWAVWSQTPIEQSLIGEPQRG